MVVLQSCAMSWLATSCMLVLVLVLALPDLAKYRKITASETRGPFKVQPDPAVLFGSVDSDK